MRRISNNQPTNEPNLGLNTADFPTWEDREFSTIRGHRIGQNSHNIILINKESKVKEENEFAILTAQK